MLNYHWIDNNKNVTLVMLHGFMGDSSAFNHVTNTSYNRLTIDLPGHGEDESSLRDNWSFDYIVNHLHEVIRDINGRIVLYGYSMGGRIALYYALRYGVDQLILESVSPGLKTEQERSARRQTDAARGISLMTDYESFVQKWEKLPLFHTNQPLNDEQSSQLKQMRRNQCPTGLNKALIDYGTGSMPNLWDELERLSMPVLLLTGTLDKKFEVLNEQMKQRITHAKHIKIKAGHTIHVEHPQIFDTIVLEFIEE